jgi:Methane oxygenase PmoA
MSMRTLLGCIAVLVLAAPASHAQGGKPVQIKKAKDALEFYVGDELVTRYLIGMDRPKPIFWPVNAPGGVPLTRSWPQEKAQPGEATDHPHQQSAWFCHGDIIPEGIELNSKLKGIAGVDFWSVAKGHGKIVHLPKGAVQTGNDFATAKTWNEWRTSDGMKIMDETRTIRLYDLGKARLIVVEIDLHASVCPITFADTKEGAFGIRINDVINAEAAKKGKPAGKGKIQNAEGKIGEKDCWGQISAWCDYSGPIDGKEVGLAILVDPKNPHPTCWHVRGYGLMAANPFGRDTHARFPAMKGNNDLVKLKKGEHYQVRYGMLLHTGDAVSGEVAANYKRFVDLRGKD